MEKTYTDELHHRVGAHLEIEDVTYTMYASSIEWNTPRFRINLFKDGTVADITTFEGMSFSYVHMCKYVSYLSQIAKLHPDEYGEHWMRELKHMTTLY